MNKRIIKWILSQFCLCVKTSRSVPHTHIFQSEVLLHFCRVIRGLTKLIGGSWCILPAQYKRAEIEEEGKEIWEKKFLEKIAILWCFSFFTSVHERWGDFPSTWSHSFSSTSQYAPLEVCEAWGKWEELWIESLEKAEQREGRGFLGSKRHLSWSYSRDVQGFPADQSWAPWKWVPRCHFDSLARDYLEENCDPNKRSVLSDTQGLRVVLDVIGGGEGVGECRELGPEALPISRELQWAHWRISEETMKLLLSPVIQPWESAAKGHHCQSTKTILPLTVSFPCSNPGKVRSSLVEARQGKEVRERKERE